MNTQPKQTNMRPFHNAIRIERNQRNVKVEELAAALTRIIGQSDHRFHLQDIVVAHIKIDELFGNKYLLVTDDGGEVYHIEYGPTAQGSPLNAFIWADIGHRTLIGNTVNEALNNILNIGAVYQANYPRKRG